MSVSLVGALSPVRLASCCARVCRLLVRLTKHAPVVTHDAFDTWLLSLQKSEHILIKGSFRVLPRAAQDAAE